MKFPLELTFKVLAIAPQIYIRDSDNNLIMYLRQKLFKLKEDIGIFSDEERSRLIYSIKADRIIDFSARYDFTNESGNYLGAVKRRGMRSIWRAHYDIFDREQIIFTIQEANAWIKVVDSLIGEVPILGWFTGYFFNPEYLVSRNDGQIVMKLVKIPGFLSRKFTIKSLNQISKQESETIVLSLLMMILLERQRG
jgi:hypothetical protein